MRQFHIKKVQGLHLETSLNMPGIPVPTIQQRMDETRDEVQYKDPSGVMYLTPLLIGEF